LLVTVETVANVAVIEEEIQSLVSEMTQLDVQQIAIVPVAFDDKFSLKFN
jgi:hypothetical protein